MAWVETASASFRARHASATRRMRAECCWRWNAPATGWAASSSGRLRTSPSILHSGPAGLALTNPLLPLTWLVTAPAARRYVAGWAGKDLHVLSPAALRER